MRDEWFYPGRDPMTKVRYGRFPVSRLELQTDNIVYDIGRPGSVSWRRHQVPEGHVYAFEQKEEGCALIRANAEKAETTNLTVVPGKAPESLAGSGPDRVFSAGSSGNMGGNPWIL